MESFSQFFDKIICGTNGGRGGKKQRNNNTANKGVGDVNPKKTTVVITLFFDSVKKLTVAVLSNCPNKDDAMLLSAYFHSRVQNGTAYETSKFYYELEGFVRENLSEIRKSLPHLAATQGAISVAIGSLEDSDAVQRQEILDDEQCSWEHHHHAPTCGDDNNDDGPTSSNDVMGRLEEVMEIVRLNSLNDDLDVLSIYFMRLTSKTFGRIAARIVRHRLHQSSTRVTLTPYVDGVSLTGYSKFARRGGDVPAHHIHTVRHSESGRAVEYQRCHDIDLIPAAPSSSVSSARSSSINTNAKFGSTTFILDPTTAAAAASAAADNMYFTWKCEEVALANLHKWWGDVTVPEYLGQKLVLSWKLDKGSVDGLYLMKSNNKTGDNDDNFSLNLATLRLPVQIGPPKGLREWPLVPHSSITLKVVESKATQLDDVAFSYTGKVKVEGVSISFPCLVKAAARVVAPRLREEYVRIQDQRPLLPREEDYLLQVERAAALV